MACIATETLDWREALASYSYPVNLQDFSDRNHFGLEWFDLVLKAGDRTETMQFEGHFREYAASHLEPWYEVVFWKMYSQQGRATIQTNRTKDRIDKNKISPNDLWVSCAEYVRSETKDSFSKFQRLLVKGKQIAVAFTFPAFSCPGSFPMVDTRIARYVASEGSRLGFPSTPEIEKTLRRYRAANKSVLTLYDWPFVEAWVDWCRKMAKRLSADGKCVWRARDVEMAVFRAWGEPRERKDCSKGKPRYRLIDESQEDQKAIKDVLTHTEYERWSNERTRK
ncbi:MAG: hypothetical protein ABSG52_12065 [Terriglobales bacterium]|jgi:hypothetical protein